MTNGALELMRVAHERRRLAAFLDIAACEDIARVTDATVAPHTLARRLVSHALRAPTNPRRATCGTFAKAQGLTEGALHSRASRAGANLKDILDRIVLVRIAGMVRDPKVSIAAAAETVGLIVKHANRLIRRLRAVNANDWRATDPYPLELAALQQALVECDRAFARTIP